MKKLLIAPLPTTAMAGAAQAMRQTARTLNRLRVGPEANAKP